jgi:hypothetical protein
MASSTFCDGYRAGWLDCSLGMSSSYARLSGGTYGEGYRLGQAQRQEGMSWKEAYAKVRPWERGGHN